MHTVECKKESRWRENERKRERENANDQRKWKEEQERVKLSEETLTKRKKNERFTEGTKKSQKKRGRFSKLNRCYLLTTALYAANDKRTFTAVTRTYWCVCVYVCVRVHCELSR